ncbi:uncharacterized protein LOC134802581 [Cydia splendana]|uniref:uncharacterized protein LOC134802581 n=1 Tax=Cydia splendana TaxID=1100963 RepID=UPI00300D1C63
MLKERTAQLRRCLAGLPTAVALLQEPWTGNGHIRGLSDTKGCRDLVLASAYMPGEDEPPPAELQRLVNHCERSGLAIIIGADSNAHHPLWGMETSNNRGKTLVEYLVTTNLNILNVGAEPTFVNKRCSTIIDLTLASEEVSELVMGWHVSQEASCSDHRWIRFNLLASSDTPTTRRNPRKTDRATYRKVLGESLDLLPPRDDLREPAQIEQQVNILTDSRIDSYHKACPLKPQGLP